MLEKSHPYSWYSAYTTRLHGYRLLSWNHRLRWWCRSLRQERCLPSVTMVNIIAPSYSNWYSTRIQLPKKFRTLHKLPTPLMLLMIHTFHMHIHCQAELIMYNHMIANNLPSIYLKVQVHGKFPKLIYALDACTLTIPHQHLSAISVSWWLPTRKKR